MSEWFTFRVLLLQDERTRVFLHCRDLPRDVGMCAAAGLAAATGQSQGE